jgi:hypothetical protein
VSALAARGLVAMVEPFMAERVGGRVRSVLTTEAAVRASTIAAGLGTTWRTRGSRCRSWRTWSA